MAIALGPRPEEKHDREDPKHGLVRLDTVVAMVASGQKFVTSYGVADSSMFVVAATSNSFHLICGDVLRIRTIRFDTTCTQLKELQMVIRYSNRLTV